MRHASVAYEAMQERNGRIGKKEEQFEAGSPQLKITWYRY